MHQIVKKTFLITLLLTLFVSGCSLFSSSPSSVVKKLMADSWNGDVDAMVNPWSRKAIEEEGADQIRKNAEGFAKIQEKAKAAGEDMRVEKIRETIQGDRARVFFLYRDTKGRDSVGLSFALIKEDGAWKLYRAIDIGEEEQPFDSSFAPKKSPTSAASPEPDASPIETITAPPPPPANSNRKTGTNSNSSEPTASKTPISTASKTPISTTSNAPISGGVLNSSAISLPKPAYPAAAKAVKASGTVVVSVLVDESGKVVTATAVSGHPLLRSAAEQAARIARFQPTIVGGQRVKVKGTVTYNFSPE